LPLYRAELLTLKKPLYGAMLHDVSQVLYLPFDMDDGSWARDRSGYNNHGIIYGAQRTAGKIGSALSFDGVDDYAVIEPFTVYGWEEITIAEWVYAFHPKPNASWSKFSMIGDPWVDRPAMYHVTNNYEEYTWVQAEFRTRKPDGTSRVYSYNWFNYRNSWVHIVRRFTKDREYSVWINGEKKYSAKIPANEITVLEWNPDNATYPELYRRFVLGASSQCHEWMKCLNDEVRIYNRALSEAEIKRLMYMRGL